MRFRLSNVSFGSRTHAAPAVVTAMDLGTHSIKYVRLQRRSGHYVVTHFGCHKIGSGNGSGPTAHEQVVNAIRVCMAEMNMKRGNVVASISGRSTLVRHVDFPQMPLEDMKKSLKLNSAPYLHQQYTNYNFDCHIIPPRASKTNEPVKPPAKLQVLVGGASTQDVLFCRDSMLAAGLEPMAINLAPVATINAFESSNAETMEQDTVALLDIGYENSVVSVVDRARPSLTRSIPFGGASVTSHIAKTLSLDEKAAEEEKLKMNEAVQVLVGSCLSSFARQVRSSIDFFERQNEVPVKRVFCSGGTAVSGLILQFLTDEVGLPCKSWDPTAKLEIDPKAQDANALKTQGANLAVAVGTALAIV